MDPYPEFGLETNQTKFIIKNSFKNRLPKYMIDKVKNDFNSKDVLFLKNSMELSSKKFTSVKDKKNLYNWKKFKYLINE